MTLVPSGDDNVILLFWTICLYVVVILLDKIEVESLSFGSIFGENRLMF
jgi:hypothetical protein